MADDIYNPNGMKVFHDTGLTSHDVDGIFQGSKVDYEYSYKYIIWEVSPEALREHRERRKLEGKAPLEPYGSEWSPFVSESAVKFIKRMKSIGFDVTIEKTRKREKCNIKKK
jgi:hypothetical protein